MISRLDVFLLLSFALVLGGASGLAFQIAKMPAADRPTLGARGLNRTKALREGVLFPWVEPTARFMAAWLSLLGMERIRARFRRSLTHSGDYLGLSDDELIALCLLSGLGFGGGTLIACQLLNKPWPIATVALCVGVPLPWVRVVGVAQQRARSVGRGLPAAVELASMCMSAGLDFPGSLRRIVQSASDPSEPVIEEFAKVLQGLDLGHTRRSAMEGFATRVPTDQVREFVNSVVQAEEKGSPLASVLTIQAQTQRLRRSIAAEETASEAALMLLGPMTLIFLCVIALLLGPVVVRFMTGGLGQA
ncbi:MAG: type II secretion system F family protein [Myxococcales bacterium]|nr:type II secretion system F family protein [Myxococcales bacterium]